MDLESLENKKGFPVTVYCGADSITPQHVLEILAGRHMFAYFVPPSRGQRFQLVVLMNSKFN